MSDNLKLSFNGEYIEIKINTASMPLVTGKLLDKLPLRGHSILISQEELLISIDISLPIEKPKYSISSGDFTYDPVSRSFYIFFKDKTLTHRLLVIGTIPKKDLEALQEFTKKRRTFNAVLSR